MSRVTVDQLPRQEALPRSLDDALLDLSVRDFMALSEAMGRVQQAIQAVQAVPQAVPVTGYRPRPIGSVYTQDEWDRAYGQGRYARRDYGQCTPVR